MAKLFGFNYTSKEELEEALLKLAVLEIEFDAANRKISRLESNEEILQSELEREREESSEKIKELEEVNESYFANMMSLHSSVEKLKECLKSEQDRNAEYNQRIEEMQKEIESLRNGDLKAEVDAIRGPLNDLLAKINSMDDILSKNSLKMPDQASSEETFVKQYLAGKISIDSIDDFIDQWHQGGTGTTISEFLGFSKEQYSSWVETGSIPFPK